MCFGDNSLYRKIRVKFSVVRAASPYNIILGRSGLQELRPIPSTLHAMMRFPTPRGVATLVTRATTILECRKQEDGQLLSEEKKEPTLKPIPHNEAQNTTLIEEVLVFPRNFDES
ncbi:hypothetical protein CTI12_AA435560 [Artemisia annua]|uniref:Reverse transcriptase domain-containing protein n=1 Tax=Artemisia annua TaxID=35608 RepID=A0A2U1LZN9_ARTAN|nr:hypothetical protein CTI12_AA435560 [Artemisia annua]